MKVNAAKIGAGLFLIWGLLHLFAASQVQKVAEGMTDAVAAARVTQDAWHLAMIAVFAMVIAVKWNWHNDRLGYWLNFWMVGATDLGFIFLVLLPGYFPPGMGPGLVGPAIWLLAVLFATIGYRSAHVAGPAEETAEAG